MKIKLLFLSALALMLITACSKEEIAYFKLLIYSGDETESGIESRLNSWSVESEEEMTFLAQGPWTISSSAEWLSVYPLSGDAGEYTIYFSYSENPDFETRKAVVSLNGNGITKKFTYVQDEKIGIIITNGKTEYDISYKGGIIEIPIKYNGAYLSPTFGDGCNGWIHFEEAASLTENVIKLLIDSNSSNEKRSGTIVFHVSLVDKVSVTVTQGIKDYLEIEQTTYYVSGDENYLRCQLSASETVKATSYDDWISVLSESDSYVSFAISDNLTESLRYGSVLVETSGSAIGLTIVQQPCQVPVNTYYYAENGINYGTGIEIQEIIDGEQKTIIWAPVNCGQESPDATSTNGYGLIYQWGYGSSENGAYAAIHNGNGNILSKSYQAGSSVSSTKWPSSVGNTSTGDYEKWCDNKGPCPNGWRLPSSKELIALVANHVWAQGPVGKASVLGYWCNGSNNAKTNIGVFLQAAGIIQRDTKECIDRGAKGNYWSYDCNTGMNIWAYRLSISQTLFDLDTSYKSWGFSVRCVKQ